MFTDAGDRKHDWYSVIIEGPQGPHIATNIFCSSSYDVCRGSGAMVLACV